jgi:hypothetical protein
MPSRKSSTSTIQPIDGSILGEYAVSNYSERVYSKVYYSIRSLCGLVAKRTLRETFDWDEFKERFTTDFGNVAEKRYTVEQLLEYANRKFGKSLEDLIVQNQISWQRRQEYAERTNANLHSQIKAVSESQ